MAATKAIKATTKTRRVPAEQVPAELRNLYKDEQADAAAASLNFTTTDDPDAEPVEMETLFTIDDTEYQIPREFGPSIAIIYLDVIDRGRDVALAVILRSTIGDEGWAGLMALAKKNKINKHQIAALMQIVEKKIMGAMEAMEGN
jgi:hypothetical protein